MTIDVRSPFVARTLKRDDYKGEKFGTIESFVVEDAASLLIATCPDADRARLVAEALNRPTTPASKTRVKKGA